MYTGRADEYIVVHTMYIAIQLGRWRGYIVSRHKVASRATTSHAQSNYEDDWQPAAAAAAAAAVT